jgi:hypothetical protein
MDHEMLLSPVVRFLCRYLCNPPSVALSKEKPAGKPAELGEYGTRFSSYVNDARCGGVHGYCSPGILIYMRAHLSNLRAHLSTEQDLACFPVRRQLSSRAG